MTELENIGKLAATASELLNAIRGGEIANMKAEHVQVLAEFETAYSKAITDFGTEKAQKLSEFNSQKTSALNDLVNRANAVIAKVESHLAASRDRQTHIRLTKNQELRENSDGSFPESWISSSNVTAALVEKVTSGVPAHERSALAQEFLRAINCNTRHFYGSFNIWQIEVAPVAEGTSVYLPWQQIAMSQAATTAAIVKHVSGAVPYGSYCHGLEVGQSAKLCGKVRVFNHRNGYDNIHPRMPASGVTQGAVILIALPASVTGDVDLENGAWGQFPYIGADFKG